MLDFFLAKLWRHKDRNVFFKKNEFLISDSENKSEKYFKILLKTTSVYLSDPKFRIYTIFKIGKLTRHKHLQQLPKQSLNP